MVLVPCDDSDKSQAIRSMTWFKINNVRLALTQHYEKEIEILLAHSLDRTAECFTIAFLS